MRRQKSAGSKKIEEAAAPTTSLPSILRRLSGVTILGIVSIGLSVVILKSALIPEQLTWIGAAGPILVALTIVIGYQIEPAIYLRIRSPMITVLITSFLGLLFLQGTRVFVLNVNGVEVNYLTGWKLTAWAEAMKVCQGAFRSAAITDNPRDFLSCVGPDMIPTAYGFSYEIASGLYVACYFTVVICFTLLLTLTLLRQNWLFGSTTSRISESSKKNRIAGGPS